MAKRALVIGVGGLRGAFSAGAAATLCRELGPQYFDAVYGSSVGVYAATFYVANQPDIIEKTWRNFVTGRQLVNYLNPLRGKAILDLEYLTEIFQSNKSLLDVDAVMRSPVKLKYVLTDAETLEAEYATPTREGIFRMMESSCAQPPFHRAIRVNGCKYIDGSLSDPIPFQKALDDGCDEVTVITNKPKGFYVGKRFKRFYASISGAFPNSQLARVVSKYETNAQHIEEQMERDERVRIIRPLKDLELKSMLDTDHARINLAISHGVEEAHRFCHPGS